MLLVAMRRDLVPYTMRAMLMAQPVTIPTPIPMKASPVSWISKPCFA